MSQKIMLDSGIIVASCSKNPPLKITQLFKKIASKEYIAAIINSQISEISYHLCRLYNKETSRQLIYSLIDKYNIQILEPSIDILLETGLFRKSYPKALSYVDCTLILLCNQEKMVLHTTEKRLKILLTVELANKLKIIKYEYD
jgi:predicted nucleic acid-binding protein